MRAPTTNGVYDDDLDAVEQLADTQRSQLPDTPQVEEVLWEDEPEYNLADPKEASPAPAFSQRTTTRKRKQSGKKMFLAQPTPSPRKYTPTKAKDNISEDIPPLINIDQARVRRGIHDGTAFTWDYVFDVLSTTLRLLRKPIAILLTLYVLAVLLNLVSSAFRTAFAPVCWLPLVSQSPMCYTPPAAPNMPQWADYPKLVDVETSTFEKLLDESVGNAGLSLDIKKAEMATHDLVILVKHSNLKTKDRLVEHLETFIDDSKKTGRALTRLGSRVSGAVDSVMAVNEYALQTIQEAKPSHSPGGLTDMILRPIGKGVANKAIVTDTFNTAMSVAETQISRIRLEAEGTAILLDHLEQSLITLQELLTRENLTLSSEKEKLLDELWTKLGGNKKKLRGVNNHLTLLERAGDWRMRAQAHVVATLHALDGMSEDMEDLRERVAQPELIGDSVPIEVHMKSIQAGLDRLKMDRRRARDREDESLRNILSLDEK